MKKTVKAGATNEQLSEAVLLVSALPTVGAYAHIANMIQSFGESYKKIPLMLNIRPVIVSTCFSYGYPCNVGKTVFDCYTFIISPQICK